MMSEHLDFLHLAGVNLIHSIQHQFQHYSDWMLFLTKVGDPRYAFLIYFPIAFCLRKSTGIQVLWLAVISEWMNCVLKWILHGERPYWWVHEIAHSDHLISLPDLQQYYLTCETGPGSPSGHAMVTSSVLFTIASAFLKHGIQNTNIVKKFLVWLSFGVVLMAVNVSRLFIATHFPHQVIAGSITGILLAAVIKHEHVSHLTFLHYTVLSMVLAGGAAATFYIIKIIGLNPFWSITLATKRCANADWVHPDTTPFWSLVRDVASLFGSGMALSLINCLSINNRYFQMPLILRVLQAIVTVYCAIFIENIQIPPEIPLTFYAGGFAKYFAMMLVIVAILPFGFQFFVSFCRSFVKEEK